MMTVYILFNFENFRRYTHQFNNFLLTLPITLNNIRNHFKFLNHYLFHPVHIQLFSKIIFIPFHFDICVKYQFKYYFSQEILVEQFYL
jgi:hypothetical protein